MSRKMIKPGLRKPNAYSKLNNSINPRQVDKKRAENGVFGPGKYDLRSIKELIGVEIINCSPGSALEVFPKMELEEALNA